MLIRRVASVGCSATILAAGLVFAASPAFAQAPAITAFTPISGPVSTKVTLVGSSFTGATAVDFNGKAASRYTVVSATEITATVAAGTATGPISVQSAAGLAISTTNFTMTTTPAVALSTTSGPPGSTVTVSGSGFEPDQAVDLYFDTTDEALAGTSPGGAFSLSIPVPAAATPGTHCGQRGGAEQSTNHPDRVQGADQLASVPQHSHASGPQHHPKTYSNPTTVGGIDQDWSYSTGNGVYSSPAVVNGVIYVGSLDDKVYALNATTGALIWYYTTGAGLFVAGGGQRGGLRRLRGPQGVRPQRRHRRPDLVLHHRLRRLFVAGGGQRGGLRRLRGRQGVRPQRHHRRALLVLHHRQRLASSPAVANGMVYVGSLDDNIYALNATTGALLWSYTTGSIVASSPAVANGMVYVGSEDDNVYALNATTGALLWSYTTGAQILSSPAVANGMVYVGSEDDNVYALNATTGALLWSYTTGAQILSSPAVANGVVYVGSVDDNVYALNATTGALLWSYSTGNEILSSPAVANGVVYVGSYDDSLDAFDLTGGANTPNRPVPHDLKPNRQLEAIPYR